MSNQIPSDVSIFLVKYIKTVGHLELLLFLFDGRERSWSVERLTREMRTNDSLAESQLKDLGGVIEMVDVGSHTEFKFRPTMSDVADLVRRLSELYRSRRHAVIGAIYDRKGAAIHDLAEAFVIKKGGESG